MMLICCILLLVLGIRIAALAARVAWKLTKGIVMVALFPIAGLFALLGGAVWIALVVLVIGGVASLIIV